MQASEKIQQLPDLKTILSEEIEVYKRENPSLFNSLQLISILRWFDAEVIALLLPPEQADDAQKLLEQIKGLFFCEKSSIRGVVLSTPMRDLLLSQDGMGHQQLALHRSAANAYSTLLQNLKLSPEEWFGEAALQWKILAAEWLYHLAWVAPDEAWSQLMRIFARAYAVIVTERVEVAFSYDLLNRIKLNEVGWLTDSPYPDRIKELNRRIQALLAYKDKDVLDFLEDLASTPGLTNQEIASLYQWIGSTCFRDAGKFGRAKERLEAAYRLDPTDVLINTELIAYHRILGTFWSHLDLARRYTEKLIQQSPHDPGGYIAMGDLYQDLSDWESAITWYDKARQISPQSVDAPLGLSEVYAARHRPAPEGTKDGTDDLTSALRWIDIAADMSMDMNYIALLRKGGVYLAYLKYDEARQAYEAAIQAEPARPEAYVEMGNLEAELGHSRQAEIYYQTAREKGSLVDADLLTVRLHKQKENYERAIAVCRQGIETQGKSLPLYRELHNIYSMQGRWRDMEATWQNWLEYDPGSRYMVLCLTGDAYQTWAWKQRSTREINELAKRAKSRYEQALKIDPYLAGAYVGLASLALLQNDRDALASYQETLESRAPWAMYDTFVKLGAACLEKSDCDQTSKFLTSAVQLAPWRPEAFLGLLDLYEFQGDDTRLVETWAELEKLDPTYSPSACLRMGSYYERIFDYERAREHFEQATRLANPAEAHWRLANLCKAEGNWPTALEEFRWVFENASFYEAKSQAETSAIHLTNRAFVEAESAARKAIISDREDVSGYVALAKLAAQLDNENLLKEVRGRLANACPQYAGDLEYAIAETFRMRAEYPDSGKAPEKIERSYQLTRKAKQAYMQAIIYYQKQKRECPEAELGLSLILVKQKKYKTAEKHFRHALRKFSPLQDFDAYLKLGQAYEQAGNPLLAEQNFRYAIQIDPRNPFGHLSLASILRKQGRLQDAEEEYIRAADVGAVNFLLLGRYYESQGLLEDALACYQIGMQKSQPEELPTLFQCSAILKMERQDFAGAEADLKQSIQLTPTLNAYKSLLQLMVSQERVAEAKTVLKKAMELPDLSYDLQVYYGELISSDDALFNQSVKAYRSALKLDPAQATAYELLGELLERHGKEDQALKLYREMSLQPNLVYRAHIVTGRLLADLERYKEAEKEYQLANSLDPQKVDGYQGLASIYEHTGRYAEAAQVYRQIISLANDATTRSFAYTDLGKQYILSRDLEEAIAALEQALEQFPANDDACFQLGFVFESKEKDDAAIRMYSRALDLNQKCLDAYIGLSRLYGKLQKPDKVVELVRRIRQLDIQDDEEVYALKLLAARLYTEAGMSRQARAAYTGIIRSEPDLPHAYKELAGLFLKQGQYSRAIKVFKEMATKPDLRYQAYLSIAELEASRGKLKEAEQAYRNALRAGPDLPAAYFGLATLLINQDRKKSAYQVLEKMVTQPNMAASGYYSLGLILQQEQKFADAEQAYRKASELVPTDPQPYLRLAEIHETLNRSELAEESLRQALKVAPNDAETNRTVAQHYKNKDAIADAIRFYRKAVDVDPDGESAAQTYVEMGDIYFKLEKFEDARDAYIRATEIEPKYGDAYIALGRVYGRLGDIQGVHQIARKIENMRLEEDELYGAYQVVAAAYQEGNFPEWAIEVWEKAIELDPKRIDAYLFLGKLYESEQRISCALDIYEKVLQLPLEPTTEAGIRIAIGRCYLQDSQDRLVEDKIRLTSQDRAEMEFQRAIQLYPGQSDAYQFLGQLYEIEQKFSAAVDLYNRVLQLPLDPTVEASVRVAIGRCYCLGSQDRQLGEDVRLAGQKKAQAEFHRAMELVPEYVDAYFQLGISYEDQGRWDEAIKTYELVLDRGADPASSAYLSIASIRRRQGKQEDARQACLSVLACHAKSDSPDYCGLLRRKGLAFFMLGRYEEAEKELKRVLEKNNKDFSALFYRSLNLLCRGKVDEALCELQAGIKRAPRYGDYRYILEEAHALSELQPNLPGLEAYLSDLEEAAERRRSQTMPYT